MAWANAQADIVALVQIGSRAQVPARVDAYSDYDYQLISTHPNRYKNGKFTAEIAPVWVYSATEAFGKITKVSAIYEDAIETDFVILNSLSIRIVNSALRFPALKPYWPKALRAGSEDLQRVAGLGWKMVKDAGAWADAYSRLVPFRRPMSRERFEKLCGEFWTQVVWIVKKIQRGEYLAAVRALHRSSREILFEVLDEVGSSAGEPARPEARYMERWAPAKNVSALSAPMDYSRDRLLESVRSIVDIFVSNADTLRNINNWPLFDSKKVARWVLDAR